MRPRTALVGAAVTTTVVALTGAGTPVSQAATTPVTPKAKLAIAGGAPYIYSGVSGSKNPVNVMKTTGVRAFTLAFILNKGTCSPIWDSGSLTDSTKTKQINAIRATGGDVVVSFGGVSGSKLGNS